MIASQFTIQVVNLLVQSNGKIQLTGSSGNFLSNEAPQWKLMHPAGLGRPPSIYENYNIPPLAEFMDLMPSSRHSMACCSSIHGEMVTCFGGFGIVKNREVNMSKADRIRTSNAVLYKYDVLDDYWTWNNLNYSWRKIGVINSSTTTTGTYKGGCWTDSKNVVWFGGGLVREGQLVVAAKDSFHSFGKPSQLMPRLAQFSYWTDHGGKYMYLFGGHNDLLRYSNDIWRITTVDTMKSNWSMIHDGGLIEPRINAAVLQYGKTIYIFGGESLIHSCFADLWMLVDKRWTKLYGHNLDKLTPNHRSLPQHPGCRKHATILPVDGMNQLKIRGGVTNGNLTMTDTWLYSVTRARWVWYEGHHHPNIIPFQDPVTSKVLSLPAFHNSAHWVDHRGYEYYFGGCGDHQCTVLYNWVWKRE